MWKKIILYIICLMLFCACSTSKDNSSTKVMEAEYEGIIMPGMEHLYAENEEGYYFDTYSDLSRDKERNGVINVSDIGDTLYFKVESAGRKREIAVQVFIDYAQTPIRVNGNEYDTYYINADEAYSQEIPFQIAEDISDGVNHKIMAAMTVSSDMNAVNTETERVTDKYSIAYDEILVVGEGKELYRPGGKEPIEESIERYQDFWEGALVNDDLTTFKRKLPPKEIVCKAGENIELAYHLGGFEDCGEVLLLVCLDMKQVHVNQKNYIHVQGEKDEIAKGTFKIEVPDTPGLCDLTGWVVKNPFSDRSTPLIPLKAVPRFTLRVE